jgi:serine phosphatase RsbU (regulator of sigma subunit)
MNIFETEFWGITNGMFITFVGLIAIAIVIYRWRRKELSLLSFGLFCLIYGIRWLAQTPTMQVLVGFPFSQPYFERLLSYLIAIPISAFFVLYFGPGIYNSMLWVFRTIVAYALIVIVLDLFREVSISTPSYHPVAVILWCLVWAVNLVIIKRKHDIELKVIRIAFIILLFTIGHDQMTFMGILPWEIHLEHTGLLIFSIGLAFIAGHHFFTGERKLLAIEQEIEIARRIQYAILPAGLPLPGGIEFAAKYIPMSTVGGDFYDIQTNEEDNVGILIADVSGHGVGAALIASMLKIAFTSQVKHLADPAKVLTEINTILQGNMEYSFITACCIYVDIDNGEFRYANAGHPPPLLWKSQERQWYTCSVHGTAIGPIPNASYTNEAIHIGEGDRLVLYTDGITEASNKTGEFYGIKRLTSFFETHASNTARSVIDNFAGQLEAWSGRTHKQSFDDDITLIVLDKVTK